MAQPASAQGEIGAVARISDRDPRFRQRFTDLLLSESKRDLQVGWHLARDLGRPVAPLLWRMFDDETSNVDRRLVLLIAAVQAGGLAGDRRLFELLDQQSTMLQERTMAALLLALGPRRPRPVPRLWSRLIGPNKEPEPLLGLAARLACARFPESSDGAPTTDAGDPGLLTAAMFAGLRVSSTQRQRLWRNRSRHAGLLFRGALLGENLRLANGGTDPRWIDRAREHARSLGVQHREVTSAAMLLLARNGELPDGQLRPDWQLLQLVASQPNSVEVLREWLQAAPLAIDEQPERLAVAYALIQPVARVVKERAVWAAEPSIRRHVAVALAFRLLAGEVGRAFDGVLPPVPGIPEWPFAIWASGGPFTMTAPLEDERLLQLARLIADDRAPRPVVRDTLEQTLWRQGSHPGLGPWQQERLLIRDLLLSGSNRGGGKYLASVPSHLRYFPTGLSRNDEFFSIGVSLYEFLEQPSVPMPEEYRW